MINSNVLFLVGGTGAPTFERENVRSVGFTEDLPRFFAAGDIATVPKGAGSGTRPKLFQYTNRGDPIVTTEKGIEGISAHNGEYALIIPRVAERFVDNVACLLENESERARFGANARKLLEAKHTLDASGRAIFRRTQACNGGRHGS